MNREQMMHQAQTMLHLNKSLSANEVAQILSIALVMHLRKCSTTALELIINYQRVEGSMHMLVEQNAADMQIGNPPTSTAQ